MLSDKLKNELIVLAQMKTRDEEGQDQFDDEDIAIDAEIELARKVLDDLNIKY